jgi:hypothetical protein
MARYPVCLPHRSVRLYVFAACVVLCASMPSAAPPAQCQVTAPRNEPILSATVTSVETDPGANGWRYLTQTIHFHNLTKQSMILGLDPAKVTSTDDRGNAYGTMSVRGIGQIAGSRVDPKFVLAPDAGGDVLLEMRWRGAAVFGTVFDLKLPVRVIVPLEAGQFKLGEEHLLSFTGLKAGLVAVPKGAESLPDKLPDNTINAGPFTMQITKMTPSKTARTHAASFSARIKNTSGKPIVLAYEAGSSFGVDDQGNRYGPYDTGVSGIGISTSIKADPQLTLGPGESKDVQFTVFRRLGREVAGTMLTYYVSLTQLEVLPANQIRTMRQYSLTFPRMAGLN